VFQRKFDNIDALVISFLLDRICCFEFIQVMRQTDERFIQVFNIFWTVTHNRANITLLNHTYLRSPPNDLNFPYIYYTNKSRKEKNDFIFQNTKGQEYVFDVDDQHHDTCPKHFKSKNDPSQTVGLHSKIQIKIGILIKICAGNYSTRDKLFNGANGVFQYLTKLQSNESLIWIGFNNLKTWSITRIQNWHLYTTHIHETWTSIQLIFKEIQVGANSNHLITCTQYPIQPSI
jgi:hypothetical protein